MLALVEGAHQDGAPLVLTQEVHRLASVDFSRELDPGTASKVRRASRSYPSCATSLARTSCASAAAFFATDLDLLLRGLGVRTVVACGYLTDVCVHYTCVDAHQHDYRVEVAADVCAGSSPSAHHAALAAIEYLQHGAVVRTDSVLAARRT